MVKSKGQTKIKFIPDTKFFRLSKRSGAACYQVQTKEKYRVIYTSLNSGKTFSAPNKTLVYAV